ncbi:MAG: hypothetical protein N4A35_16265, partial [Flavobacteriales bacterium]|nr:hypothetical protein [Flavobacteriales bacterium]
MNKIYKILILIGMFFLFENSFNYAIAQDDPIFIMEGRAVDASSKKVAGVQVTVKKGGSVFKTATTSSNGKFQDLELDYGFVYTVTYTKAGYITKSISIDAKTGYYAEDVEDLSVFPADITMLKAQQNVDYSIISSSPVAKVSIDPATGGLDYDRKYIGKRGKEIARFLEEIANKEKEQKEQFEKFVRDGDAGVTAKNYDQAIANYEKALAIKDDAGVKEKISQAKHFLEKQKEAQARDKIYNEKMAAAAKSLAEKDYAFAKTQYQEASDLKPSEQAPKDKIKEIDGIIQKQLEAEQKYNQLMADGEKALMAKSFDDAIAKYTEASQLKPSEQLPKDQLAKAKKLKAEADAAAEKEKQYNDLIAKADGLFGSDKLEEAKSAYQEALGIKAGESHPTSRIAEIDKKLADQAAAAEKEKQYNDLIAKADGLFGSDKLEEAKAAYQEALGIKAGESHP